MKLAQNLDVAQSGGLGEGNAFTIANSPKAFEILSKNLYQDTILAPIREISCNAYDAHVVANRPISDIIVKLPTFANPAFTVTDFGIGLSHEEMLRLYTMYFGSIKDETNRLIGGFGLGTKAPFAYVDQFTVISRFNGTKRTYVCFKSGGVPSINLMHTEATNEPNGLTVTFPVKSTDLAAFRQKAVNFFTYWDVRPQVFEGSTKIDIPTPKLIFNGPKFGVFEWGGNRWGTTNNISALMGQVVYAVNLGAVHNFPSELRNNPIIQQTSILLKFDIGELEISPSREELSYDTRTSAAITARIQNVIKSYTNYVEGKIAAATSLYEARKLLAQHQFIANATWVNPNTGVRHAVKKDVHIHDRDWIAKFPNVVFKSFEYYGRRRATGHTPYRFAGSDHTFWTPDYLEKEAVARRKHYLDDICNSLFIVSGGDFQQISDWFDELGFPPLKKLDTLPLPPPKPKVPRAKRQASAKVKAYVGTIDTLRYPPTNGTRIYFSASEDTVELDKLGFGVWVQFYRGNPLYADEAKLNLLRYDPLGKLLPSPKNLLGFSKSVYDTKKFQKQTTDNGWKHIDDWLKEFDDQATFKLLCEQTVYSTPILYNFQNFMPNFTKLTNPLMLKIQPLIPKGINFTPQTITKEFLAGVPNFAPAHAAAEQSVLTIRTEFATLLKQKPLLSLLPWQEEDFTKTAKFKSLLSDTRAVNALTDYLNN